MIYRYKTIQRDIIVPLKVQDFIFQQWELDSPELPRFEHVTGTLLRDLAVGMPKGNSCGQDLVVVKMLCACSDITFSDSAIQFKARILKSEEAALDDAWGFHETKLAEKVVGAKRVKQFRGWVFSVLFIRIILLSWDFWHNYQPYPFELPSLQVGKATVRTSPSLCYGS